MRIVGESWLLAFFGGRHCFNNVKEMKEYQKYKDISAVVKLEISEIFLVGC